MTNDIVQPTRCSKIVVDEDPLILDIIRSKYMTIIVHVGDAIELVEEAFSIAVETLLVAVETLLVQPMQVKHTLVHDCEIVKHNGDQQRNSLCINVPWCDAATNMDYSQDHTRSEFEQELRTDSSIVVTDSNLSNFSVNVIHEMQVLRAYSYRNPTTCGFSK